MGEGLKARSGTNLPRVKEYNQARVLEIVRTRGSVSRRDIADASGLTFQTVSNIVGRLAETEIILEDSNPIQNGGKRSRGLRINREAAYSVGVQMSRLTLSVAVIDFSGDMLAKAQSDVSPADGPEYVIPAIEEMVEAIIAETSIPPEKILGVGVGVPGPLDYSAGRFLEPPNFDGWHNFPMRDELERRLGMPVKVDNNGNVACLGERWKGVGSRVTNFLCLYCESGLGSGIVMNDQLCRGWSGSSGIFAHTQVEPSGPVCYCGNRGCLELYATPQGIVREAHKALLDTLHLVQLEPGQVPSFPEKIEDVVESEATVFRKVIQRISDHLGIVVSQVASILDPEVIVLNGPTIELVGEDFKHAIIEALPICSLPSKPLPRVELSSVGRHAGSIGAATLVFQDLYVSTMEQLNLASG